MRAALLFERIGVACVAFALLMGVVLAVQIAGATMTVGYAAIAILAALGGAWVAFALADRQRLAFLLPPLSAAPDDDTDVRIVAGTDLAAKRDELVRQRGARIERVAGGR